MMLMLKSTHKKILESTVKRLEDKLEDEAEAHKRTAASLQKQIELMERLVFPPTTTAIEAVTLEADSVISADDKPYQISSKDHEALMAAEREVDLLFSGDYDTDLFQGN